MQESNIGISTDQKTWETSVDVVANKKVSIFFRVDSEGCDQMQFLFPVMGYLVTPAIEAITDVVNWERSATKMKVVSESTGIETPHKSDGWFSVNFNGFTGVFEVEFDVTTIKIDNGSTAVCVLSRYKLIGDQYIKQGNDVHYTVNIAGMLVPPEIEYFTTSNGAVLIDKKFKLSWKVKNATKVTLKIDGHPAETVVALKIDEEHALNTLKSTFTLSATNVSNPHNPVESVIHIYGGQSPAAGQIPAFKKDALDKMDGQLLNLIKLGEDLMYAMVSADGDVRLWETTDGANWRETAVSFNNKVPIEFAGSGAVFYKGKIYLIGGSRYDVNLPSNSVYFYDTMAPEQGWQKDRDWPGIFTPRMGHAVVVVVKGINEEIYLIGGHGIKGTYDDMYIFNETDGWRKQTTRLLDGGLCLQNVIYDGKYINMYGGFSRGPGNPNQKVSDFSRYDVDEKTWRKREWKSPDPEMYLWNFITCAAALYNDAEFIFGVYRLGGKLHHLTAQIMKDMTLGIYETAHFIPYKIYCISVQAITFKNAVWLSIVSDEGTLKSENLSYFLFKDKDKKIDK